MRRVTALLVLAALLSGCGSVAEHNEVYFAGVLDATGPHEPRATFMRFVKQTLEGYNNRTNAGRLRADYPTETLAAIVEQGDNSDSKMETALLLLSLRGADEAAARTVRAAFQNVENRPFTRLHAGMALAYWDEDDGREFFEEVLRHEHGPLSSSGFEESYSALGLYMLGELPEDFRFSERTAPSFWHLDAYRAGRRSDE